LENHILDPSQQSKEQLWVTECATANGNLLKHDKTYPGVDCTVQFSHLQISSFFQN